MVKIYIVELYNGKENPGIMYMVQFDNKTIRITDLDNDNKPDIFLMLLGLLSIPELSGVFKERIKDNPPTSNEHHFSWIRDIAISDLVDFIYYKLGKDLNNIVSLSKDGLINLLKILSIEINVFKLK